MGYDTRTGQQKSLTPCVGDADGLFYDAKLNRIYVIGGGGFVDVFQLSGQANELMPKGRLRTAARARTGLWIPEWQMRAVAAPHTTNGPAATLLFEAKP